MSKHITLIILIILSHLSSCGLNMGDRIDAKNLQVYYLDEIKKEEAIAFTQFWIKNGFTGEKKQTIQLGKNDDHKIFVKLIEKEIYHNEPLSIQEQALLQALERTLSKEVFKKQVNILITDNTFREIQKSTSYEE